MASFAAALLGLHQNCRTLYIYKWALDSNLASMQQSRSRAPPGPEGKIQGGREEEVQERKKELVGVRSHERGQRGR